MLSSKQTYRLQGSLIATENLLANTSMFVRIEWTQIASRMYVFYLKLFEKKYSFDLEASQDGHG